MLLQDRKLEKKISTTSKYSNEITIESEYFCFKRNRSLSWCDLCNDDKVKYTRVKRTVIASTSVKTICDNRTLLIFHL